MVAVDGGRRQSTGGKITRAITDSFGLSRINIAVSTHGDADHAGGLPYVIANIGVGEVWIQRPQDHPRAITAAAQNIVITHDHHKSVPMKEPFSDNTERTIPGLHILAPSSAYFQELLTRGLWSADEIDEISAVAVGGLSSDVRTKAPKQPSHLGTEQVKHDLATRSRNSAAPAHR